MNRSPAIDWPSVELVVFDVDGTLYRQRPVRLRMAAALIAECVRRRDTRVAGVLRHYRILREALAEREVPGFEAELRRTVAASADLPEKVVHAIVDHWIHARPLPLLAAARFAAVDRLFDRIRATGRRIGVLSDYPAAAKLSALGLKADIVISAADETVGLLKPSPAGLLHLMDEANARPAATILIGDRAERDGVAGRRAGVRTFLRSDRPVPGFQTFRHYRQIMPPESPG